MNATTVGKSINFMLKTYKNDNKYKKKNTTI